MDVLSINTIRGLCLDAIQRAKSGHSGTPMDIAPVAYTLWQRFLRFDPSDSIWPNRDRFVLSEGHASALLWSLLHLMGVRAVDADYEVRGRPAVTLEDLKTFRRLDGVYDWFAEGIGRRGSMARAAWEARFKEYASVHPALADEIERMQRRELPDGWEGVLPSFPADPNCVATLPTLDRSRLGGADGVARGAYVLADAPDGRIDVILLATGSEVALAVAVREELAGEGIGVRMVSMPCWELFDRRPREYRDQVLPPEVTARGESSRR